jgi:hypothetical protein
VDEKNKTFKKPFFSYMYRGEINVEESELVGLLSTAKGLQIKGLTDSNEESASSPKPVGSRCKSEEEPSPSKPISKRKESRDESAIQLQPKRIKEERPLIPEEHVSMELNEGNLSQDEDPAGYPEDDPDDIEDDYQLPEGPYLHDSQPEPQLGGPVS